MIRTEYPFVWRRTEFFLLLIVSLLACLGFIMVHVARLIRHESGEVNLWVAIVPPLTLIISLFAIHLALSWRSSNKKVTTAGYYSEQLLLPLTGTLLALGLIMIERLRPFREVESGWQHLSALMGCYTGSQICPAVWQQISRGLLPGVITILILVLSPQIISFIQRGKIPLIISTAGLGLLLATAFFGVEDETGARLAINLPGIPVIQTTEIIKLTLIILLAWFINDSGRKVNYRPLMFGPFQLPQPRYIWLSLCFVGIAILSLVKMSDWGAILIVLGLFAGLVYIGLEPPLFRSTALLTLAFALVAGIFIFAFWSVPSVIENRWLAYQDPWSHELTNWYGQQISISDGPGYQVQQSIYAIIAGGIVGSSLGFGSPGHIPLPYSDYILAALAEEVGLIVMLPLLAFFVIIVWRILRISIRLSEREVFERILLIGIAIHLSLQVLVMTAGVTKAAPATGLTVAFLSLGGMALWVNLAEIGIALALARRVEAT